MTERIYDFDSHAASFTATVLACEPSDRGYDIILDRTAFFPGGGGQDADTGTLNERPVLFLREQDGQILHHMADPVAVGSRAAGEIRFSRRFSDMQQHSGEHVLCALLHRHYGVDNIGFHMGRNEVTMDVNGVFEMEQLLPIEAEANLVVAENRPITVSYPTEEELSVLDYRSKEGIEGPTRIVTIEGIDRCACCAPHVRLTGEIGLIKILGAQHYKGGTRISILCGQRALSYVQMLQEQVHEVDVWLSSVPAETAAAVQKLLQADAAKRDRLIQVQRRLIALLAEKTPSGTAPYCVFEDFEDVDSAREYVNLMRAKREGPVALFLPRQEGVFQYIIGGTAVRSLGQQVNQVLHGRGGGSEAMVQGTVHAGRKEIEDFFLSIS